MLCGAARATAAVCNMIPRTAADEAPKPGQGALGVAPGPPEGSPRRASHGAQSLLGASEVPGAVGSSAGGV